MRASKTLRVSVLFSLFFVIACHSDKYIGDGELVDAGKSTAHERYVLSLGEIYQGEYSFTLKGLPREKFTVGFQIIGNPRTENLCDTKPINNQIDLELTDTAGKMLFSETGPLNEWIWSCRADSANQSFVYLGRNSGNSGFTPNNSKEYLLTVEMAESVPEGFTMQLMAKGGGWK